MATVDNHFLWTETREMHCGELQRFQQTKGKLQIGAQECDLNPLTHSQTDRQTGRWLQGLIQD